MADRFIVLRDGVVEQQGRPLELYERSVNRIPGVVGDDGRSVELEMDGRPPLPLGRPAEPGRPVTVALRPENLSPRAAGEPGSFSLEVAAVELTGSTSFVVTGTGLPLTVAVPGQITPEDGRVHVRIDPSKVRLFDR